MPQIILVSDILHIDSLFSLKGITWCSSSKTCSSSFFTNKKETCHINDIWRYHEIWKSFARDGEISQTGKWEQFRIPAEDRQELIPYGWMQEEK